MLWRVANSSLCPVKTAILAVHRGFEPGLQWDGRIEHDHAGKAAVRIADSDRKAVGQPEDRHSLVLPRPLPHRKQPTRIHLELLGRGFDGRRSIGRLNSAEPLALCSKLVDDSHR
jgi:hypothetical protein